MGTAEPLDLALLRVEAPADRLVPLVLGNSDKLEIGQETIAIGNPFGMDFSVSTGVVSAIRRNPGVEETLILTLIQTDAAINPGNSGGPLLNSSGQVIGINSAIVSTSTQSGMAQSSGVGFAIPMNVAKDFLPKLRAGQKLDAQDILTTRPNLGIRPFPVAVFPSSVVTRYKLPDHGLMVQQVTEGGPAAKAGLRPASQQETFRLSDGSQVQIGVNGDVILEAGGQTLNQPSDLQYLLVALKPGQTITLLVWRDGSTRTVIVTPQFPK